MGSDCETHGNKRNKRTQEEDQPENGLEDLPLEIVFEIVSKLPISSLVQFKYVCRSWYLFTQDPCIAELFKSRTIHSDPCLIFHCDYPIRNHLYFVDFPANSREKEIVKRIHTPFSASLSEFDVISSCNGLLCLSDSLYNDGIYIYNPFARDYIELPKSIQYPNQKIVLGFGFHQITKEYKVVKIIYYRNGNRSGVYRNDWRLSPPKSDIQILTLGSNKWRSIGQMKYCLNQWPSPVLINGRLHWVAWQRRRYNGSNLISFDLADEQFREIPKPDGNSLRRRDYHLVVIRGCLSAVFYCRYGKLAVWVMKDYGVDESWVKEFNIGSYVPRALKQEVNKSFKISKYAVKGKFARILCVLRNGEILLEYNSRALVLYDPQIGKFQDVKFSGMPDWFQTLVHVGSLNPIGTLVLLFQAKHSNSGKYFQSIRGFLVVGTHVALVYVNTTNHKNSKCLRKQRKTIQKHLTYIWLVYKLHEF